MQNLAAMFAAAIAFCAGATVLVKLLFDDATWG